MMKNSLLSLAFLLFCLNQKICAQDLHIHYDAETSLIKYIYDGEEIKRPKIKKDGNIFLHVENYNNYIYSLEVNSNNQILQIPPGSGLSNIISMPGASGGGFFGPTGSGADGGFFIDEDEGGFGFGESEEYEQFMELYAEYEGILDGMAANESNFSKIHEEVKNIQKERDFRSIGYAEIQKIKWNPNFSPNQIKRMTSEFLIKILDIEDTSQLTLDYVIKKGDDQEQLEKNLIQLEKNKQEYQNYVKALGDFNNRINGIQMSFDEFAILQQNAASVYKNSRTVQESIETQKSVINNMYQTTNKKELQKMTSLWYEYEALMANDFSYTYRTDASGDRTVLSLKFTAMDSTGRILPINKKELAPIKVPVYGGLKINVSVGLSFAQYFNQPQSYYLRDTVVLSEEVDQFLPIITSFFHFYPQSAGNISIGGNFGIGIPLTNSDIGQSLSFFLGPSFIIGKGQRIVISTGVMGGRVQQLSQGLKVGDVLPPFSTIPTKNAYQMGYFLGVSFNIAGG